MPIYQCLTAPGVVTDELKPHIAKEITRLHCEATKAPPSFVHVLFQELTAGAHYLGGQLDTTATWINGLIRAGRPLAVRQQMMKDIVQSWTKLTGQPADQLLGRANSPVEVPNHSRARSSRSGRWEGAPGLCRAGDACAAGRLHTASGGAAHVLGEDAEPDEAGGDRLQDRVAAQRPQGQGWPAGEAAGQQGREEVVLDGPLAPLDQHGPISTVQDKLRHADLHADGLPPQPPDPPDAGAAVPVQS